MNYILWLQYATQHPQMGYPRPRVTVVVLGSQKIHWIANRRGHVGKLITILVLDRRRVGSSLRHPGLGCIRQEGVALIFQVFTYAVGK